KVCALLLAVLMLAAACGGPREAVDVKRAASLIAQGWEEYRVGEFQRAEWRFEDAVEAAPEKSVERSKALYGLATSLRLRGTDPKPAKAAELYRKVVAADPQGDLAAWSLLALARMEHVVPVGQEPDYPKVRAAYQEVIGRFPFHLAGEEAFIYQQATFVATLKPEDAAAALKALRGFIAGHARSRFVSPAWALEAECFFTLKRPAERLAAEVKALETTELDPTNPIMDHANAYWKIASVAEFEAGDFGVARRYYKKLVDEYPTDIRRYGAQQAILRMSRAGG
ncbi:MAG: tetratricopeptide repeat protein, partial [bacterium]